MKKHLLAAALVLAASAASAAKISEYLTVASTDASVPSNWIACLETTGECRYNKEATAQVFSTLPLISPSAGGVTDITIVESPTTIAVQSSSGADDTIALANGTNAGAMSPGHYTKLEGIEAGADATDATNVDAAGAVMNSDASTAGMGFVIDEDNMVSDSATKVPTQQSVKAYVDAASLGGGAYYATDGDVGLIIGASGNVTTTATPNVANTAEVNLNVTACTGLTVSKATGTVGTGKIFKQITITNSCGGDLDVTWDVSGSGYKKAGNLDVDFTLSTGTFKTVDIMTPNQGTDWYILTGEKDVSTLPTGTVAGTSLLEVRTAAGAVIKSTVQAVLDLLSGVYEPADATILKDADIGSTVQAYAAALTSWAAKAIPTGVVVGDADSQTLTNKTLTAPIITSYPINNQTGTTYSVVASDKGKVVTCNNGSPVAVTVPTAAITWADGDVVMFLNKGAGACTISGSGVTITFAADQTAALAQYKSATLFFTSDTTAILTGGMTGS